MLKIQLTWLQPSLGLLGVALLLCAPMAASAAPKSAVATKTPKHKTVATSTTGSVTPDMAVRQLALDTMAQSGVNTPSAAALNIPQSNLQPLASFLPPTAVKTVPAQIATKPSLVQHSVAAAVTTKASRSSSTAIVPGLFIGRAEVSSPSNISPAPAFTARLIAAPKPTAEMFAGAAAATPFPVVMPAQMQGLKFNQKIASIPNVQTTPESSNPIASIPAGLQRILGNAPIGQPNVVPVAPIAKTVAPKSDALYALNRLVSPETSVAPMTTARGASLQLGTAQAYALAPQFNLSGTKTSNSVPAILFQAAKPKLSLFAAKPAREYVSTTVIQRKNNYVSLVSDKFVTPIIPAWTTSNSRHSLGGLILGSQSQGTANLVALLPMPGLNRSSIN